MSANDPERTLVISECVGAVAGLPDDKWGEIIACFIRSEGNRELDVGELRDHCREYLSAQKTPVVWCKVEAFPPTGSGKVRKFALRDGYLAEDYEPLCVKQ